MSQVDLKLVRSRTFLHFNPETARVAGVDVQTLQQFAIGAVGLPEDRLVALNHYLQIPLKDA